MKKLYIQPTIEVSSMATLAMIADSGKVKGTDYTDADDQSDIDKKLTGGDGSDFAKQRGFFSDEYED